MFSYAALCLIDQRRQEFVVLLVFQNEGNICLNDKFLPVPQAAAADGRQGDLRPGFITAACQIGHEAAQHTESGAGAAGRNVLPADQKALIGHFHAVIILAGFFRLDEGDFMRGAHAGFIGKRFPLIQGAVGEENLARSAFGGGAKAGAAAAGAAGRGMGAGAGVAAAIL